MAPTQEMIEAAQGIVGEARKKAQHIERQAYAEGFEQGQKDGREVGERSLDQQVQQFRDLVQALAREKEELYLRREKDLLEMVLLISRKVVVRELKLQPEAIQEIVAQGFKILADTENIKLRIHPQDHEILQWAPQESWPPGVELIPDGTVSPGGFLMETACGDIDGTVKNRWAVLDRMVQKALQGDDEHAKAD
jgi:flagellar assembly protein FliH